MSTPFPSPPKLHRSFAAQVERSDMDQLNDEDESPQQRTARYLNYECTYKACKYADPGMTWGQLVRDDYEHFKQLMHEHVPLESKTFDALKSQLRNDDLETAKNNVRFIDTPDQTKERVSRYMEMTCQHNGRMKGKTWKKIFELDYPYFMWSVGNTMGRDTRTFKTFVTCLKDEDRELVMKTPKGSVKRIKKTLRGR